MSPHVLSLFRNFRLHASLALLLSLVIPAMAAAPFRTARTTRTADAPHSGATGDFNNDGKVDVALVTGDANTNTMQVLLGVAGGTLGSASTYRLNAPGFAVAVADFNNDGKQDLAVSTQKGVNVLLGNGDGTFGAAQAYTASLYAISVSTADFNGDGKMDILAAGGNFEVDLLLGNGDGTFQPGVVVGSWLYGKLALGDFNGDGKQDFASIFSNIEVHLGNGDGTFQPAQIVSLFNVSGSPISLLAADFNGDGKLDLALLGYVLYGDLTAPVFVFAGNGDGTFQNARASSVQSDEFPVSFAAADMNGDGKTDIVVANVGSNDISVMTGVGNGNFNTVQHWAAGPRVNDVLISDFNGDGKPDSLALNDTAPGSVSMLLGIVGNNLTAARDFAAGYQPWFVITGDFNEDGIADVVTTVQYPSAFWISNGLGNGVFVPASEVLLKAGNARQGVAADLNGDGHLDLILTYFDIYYDSRTVGVLLGNGDGTFQKETDYLVGSGTENVAVADFTGDGIPDIMVSALHGNQGFYGAAELLIGNGDGTFQKFKSAISFNGYYPNWMVAADFNRDGKVDLAFGAYDFFNLAPWILVSLGNGDGTFQTPGKAESLTANPVFLTTGDLNGDGIIDLVSVNYAAANLVNTVSVMLGDGDGTFQLPVNYNSGATPNMAVLGDFSGDGLIDIAVSNQLGWVGLLTGKGDGTFSQGSIIQAGNAPYGLASADFNGDLRPDLVVVNQTGNNVTVMLNTVP